MLQDYHNSHQKNSFLRFWYAAFAPSQKQPITDYRAFEFVRRAQMTSLVILLVIVGALLGFLDTWNTLRTITLLGATFLDFIALMFNKRGRITAASVITVCSAQCGLLINVLIISSGQQAITTILALILLIEAELVTVSLLRPPSLVFISTLLNCVLTISLIISNHLPGQYGGPIMGMYVIFAGISWLWVTYQIQTSMTADWLDAKNHFTAAIAEQERSHIQSLEQGVTTIMKAISSIANDTESSMLKNAVRDDQAETWVRQVLIALETLRKRVMRNEADVVLQQKTMVALNQCIHILMQQNWQNLLFTWKLTNTPIDLLVRQLQFSLEKEKRY